LPHPEPQADAEAVENQGATDDQLLLFAEQQTGASTGSVVGPAVSKPRDQVTSSTDDLSGTEQDPAAGSAAASESAVADDAASLVDDVNEEDDFDDEDRPRVKAKRPPKPQTKTVRLDHLQAGDIVAPRSPGNESYVAGAMFVYNATSRGGDQRRVFQSR